MFNPSAELIQKCKDLWSRRNTIKLRFLELKNKNLLNANDIEILTNCFAWSKQNECAEIIGAVALNLPQDKVVCRITNQEVKFCIPFYRLYSDKEILHQCFRPKITGTSNAKWKWSLYKEYDYIALQEICEAATTHSIFKCPMMVNHCYVWLESNNIDINEISTPAEAIYLWKNKITKIPVCPFTNKKLKFSSGKYAKHSKEGAHIQSSNFHKGKIVSNEQVEKTKQTNLLKYGTTSPLMTKETREKAMAVKKQKAKERKERKELEKSSMTRKQRYHKTMTERYGGPTMKNFLEKNPRTEESKKRSSLKMRETWLKNYGTEKILSLPEIRNKIKQTNQQRYGYNTFLSTPEQKQLRLAQENINTYNNFKRFANYCVPMFTLEEWLKDPKAEFTWKLTETNVVYKARYWGYAPRGRFTHSLIERKIHSMLQSWDIEFVKSDRQTITPLELDILVPSKSLAIECNGEYFHSEERLERNYHEHKRNAAKSKGITLLQFFGNEIILKEKAVKSVIRNALNLNSRKLYARKTKVCAVSPSYARKFYDKYHIHGFCGALKHYGLTFNGKVVQMLSLGLPRFQKIKNGKEIIRSATVYNFNVIGGLSKLLTAAKIDFPTDDIHTYADLSCFSGKGYEKTGFEFVNTTPPSYFYFKDTRHSIYSRYQAQKHKLKKLLGDKFDPLKTEEENMKTVGYLKVYRCCHKHFVLKRQTN